MLTHDSFSNYCIKIYALQAEALLKLHRHQEAYESYLKAPNISIEIYIKLFGLAVSSYILMIEAEVYMAAGRLMRKILFSFPF